MYLQLSPLGHQIRNADVINAFVVIRSIEILCFVITHCFGVNTLETTNFIMNSHMSGNIPTDILVTNTTNSSLGSSLFRSLVVFVLVLAVPVTLIVGGV